ncbi:hypothetical protein KF840_07345 [bacterium]|nr:hypothetical protein [bacterium]
MGAARCILAFACALAAAPPAGAVSLRPQYAVRATIEPAAPQLDGTVEVAFTNHAARPLHDAVFLLFANRFAAPDTDLNDFTRSLVYPDLEFHPGGLELLEVRDGGVPTQVTPLPVAGLPEGTFVSVAIAPLAPGETRTLTLAFRTTLPPRFGTFGAVEDQLTAIGGWYPSLVPLADDGTWTIASAPPLADFDVTLTPAAGLDVILNGRYLPAGAPLVHATVPAVHDLTLVAAPRFASAAAQADGATIRYYYRPPARGLRIAFGPSLPDVVLETLRTIVALRPPVVPAPAGELVVVAAPLRVDLDANGEGDVIVSDKLLELQSAVRPFHELHLAQAVYQELLRPQLARRESARDYPWVSEGVSRLLAYRYMDVVLPERRSVYDWIELFNVFAIVDRFEATPNIAFTGAFFENAKQADPMHAEVWSVTDAGPPGRVVLGKLRTQVGPAAFDPLLDRCLSAPQPLRDCLAAGAPDQPVAARLETWLGPYPAIDYRVEQTAFNVREGDRYRNTVAVRRVSSRPFPEPVTIRLRSIGGEHVDVQWKSPGDVALVSATTEGHVYQAIVDPDRQLIDDDRANNAWLPRLQVVVDSADVAVTSTEFAIGALALARLRYDYSKDVGLTAFYTNRGIGFAVGPRLHWGEPVDNARFRHNLYGFYTFTSLDRSFTDDRHPDVRTGGQLGGIGARYDYTNVFWGDAPTSQRRLRLFADWFDTNLGSDYGYLDWGYLASATLPLGTPRTVAAAEIVNGFSEPFNSLVPNQGLYSLGGERTIRGISAEAQLARNVFVLRSELRQVLTPDLDFNLHDIVVLRRISTRLLFDTGQTSNSAGRIYDLPTWAMGAGAGIGITYDFFGFFSAAAYLDLATRLDRNQGDVQVLFGSAQSF